MVFILYKFSKNKGIFKWLNKSKTENVIPPEKEHVEISSEETLKDYISGRIRSPIFIVGAILIAILIFVAIFHQLITPYSYEYLLQPHAGSWVPPSPEHPLGQTVMGGDVLGRMIFGIQNSLIAGLSMVLIGLSGSIPLGYIAGKYKRWGYKPIMGSMILFYILPGFVLATLTIAIYGPFRENILVIIGILLIPNIARVIANRVSQKINIHRLGIAVIKLIPFNFAIALLIFHSLGFLGFNQSITISLGNEINVARENPYDAPWASFWPGLTIFGIVFSFLILHIGLQDFGLKKGARVYEKKNELVIREI